MSRKCFCPGIRRLLTARLQAWSFSTRNYKRTFSNSNRVSWRIDNWSKNSRGPSKARARTRNQTTRTSCPRLPVWRTRCRTTTSTTSLIWHSGPFLILLAVTRPQARQFHQWWPVLAIIRCRLPTMLWASRARPILKLFRMPGEPFRLISMEQVLEVGTSSKVGSGTMNLHRGCIIKLRITSSNRMAANE